MKDVERVGSLGATIFLDRCPFLNNCRVYWNLNFNPGKTNKDTAVKAIVLESRHRAIAPRYSILMSSVSNGNYCIGAFDVGALRNKKGGRGSENRLEQKYCDFSVGKGVQFSLTHAKSTGIEYFATCSR